MKNVVGAKLRLRCDMTAVLYLLNVGCMSAQSVLSKSYAHKNGNAATFNKNKALSGIIAFTLFGLFGGLSFHIPSFLFGICYGILLCISMQTGFKALAIGPITLTSTIVSFSLIIPFLYGITVWKESLSIYGIIGIFLLLSAIILLNLKKESGISLKWSAYTFVTLLANGGCSIIQKYHQIYYPHKFRLEFMLAALALTLAVLTVTDRSKKQNKKVALSIEGLLAGILNAAANYIILLLAATQNASVLFPLASVSNIIAVCFIGKITFKEKLKVSQLVGIILGLISIVLLNIKL